MLFCGTGCQLCGTWSSANSKRYGCWAKEPCWVLMRWGTSKSCYGLPCGGFEVVIPSSSLSVSTRPRGSWGNLGHGDSTLPTFWKGVTLLLVASENVLRRRKSQISRRARLLPSNFWLGESLAGSLAGIIGAKGAWGASSPCGILNRRILRGCAGACNQIFYLAENLEPSPFASPLL